jgi:hypothetical protein
MAAMARELQVSFDCDDPAALAGFWAQVLDYRIQGPPSGFDTWDAALAAMGIPPERRNDASALVDPAGTRPRIFFQRVPEGKTAKNRVHLDFRAAPGLTGAERMAALEECCARLVALGATRIARHEPAPPLQAGHLVLTRSRGQRVLPGLSRCRTNPTHAPRLNRRIAAIQCFASRR